MKRLDLALIAFVLAFGLGFAAGRWRGHAAGLEQGTATAAERLAEAEAGRQQVLDRLEHQVRLVLDYERDPNPARADLAIAWARTLRTLYQLP